MATNLGIRPVWENVPVLREFCIAYRQATGVRLSFRTEPTVGERGNVFEVPVIVDEKRVGYLQGHDDPPSPMRKGGGARLVRLFLGLLAQQMEQYLMANGHHDPSWLKSAKQYMASRAGDDLTVEEVARHVHYSAEYLRKRFRTMTGLSFGGYLARLRVDRAKALIANPHQRISEVAFAVGFQSIPSFNRVFKQHTGVSPTAYRSMLRAGWRPPKTEKRKAARE